MPRPREITIEARWEQFLARYAFACPTCGYDMHGLRGEFAARCPECGRYVDIETAMYVGAPIRAGVLWRTALSVWGVVLVNLLLWAGSSAVLPTLDSSRWTVRPPTVWYGLLVVRMGWLALCAGSMAAWWLDLKSEGFSSEGGQRAFRAAPRLALAMTGVHLLWVAARAAGWFR